MIRNNKIAKALYVLAILTFVGGFILGIVSGATSRKIVNPDYSHEYTSVYGEKNTYTKDGESPFLFDAMTMVYIWIGSAVTGILVLGFSEVVEQLSEINQKLPAKQDENLKTANDKMDCLLPPKEQTDNSSCGQKTEE